ncbi:MAG: DUF1697 domain-containing protein [Candidatus Margulisiibacteriota bacterium]
MPRFVAFLRGINVGGHHQIRMPDLKASFEALGFEDVKTILQTGNVVFSTAETDSLSLKPTLEAGLSSRFNYDAKVIVRSYDDVRAIAQAMPFPPAEDKHNYVVFLDTPDLAESLLQTPMDGDVEALASGDGVVYWRVDRGMTLKSAVAKQLAKSSFKAHNTVRNVKTLLKL